MDTNNSDKSLTTAQAKQNEIQTILHQLIRMLAIEIATKIKATKN